MPRKNSASILLLSLITPFLSYGNSIVDCRVVTGGITECNPYTRKIIHAKEIRYDKDRKKLIVDKTLPLPKKREKMRVISVADMIEKYVKVEEPLRFKGSQKSPYVLPRQQNRQAVFPETKTKTKTKQVTVTKPAVVTPLPKKEEKKPSVTPATTTKKEYGIYKVESGDVLGKIAHRFNVPIKQLAALNHLDKKSVLKIGQKLKLPISQEKIEILKNGEYKIEPGDTLISIAKKFDLDPKEIAKFNHMTSNTMIRAGKTIKLPFPYIVRQAEKAAKKEAAKKKRLAAKKKRVRMLRPFGKHRLRVTATAYSSHRGQTDSTPFLAAWNNRLRPGMKVIAVSRDLLTRYGLRNGTRVKIGGLPGYYTVRDKMNKRFRKRIDIYMGTNRRRALRWGRRSVTISW